MSQKELRRMLSKLGIASRKNSEEIIRAGRVSVNGTITTDPLKPIGPRDMIFLDKQKVESKKKEIYALNKPKGYVTTMAKDEERNKVSDLMPKHTYLFPVGRLDKASRGLLLFTNDNEFADFILSNRSNIEKTYNVQIKGEISQEHINEMKLGLVVEGVYYRVKDIDVIRKNDKTSWLEIVLVEGKNREIRRILESYGYEVLDLIRLQIGKLKLEDLELKPGEYKLVSSEQIV